MPTIEQAKLECVYEGPNRLGETPFWSAEEQAIYWINVMEPPTLFRLDPATGKLDQWAMPERIGAVALKPGGGAIVALASGVFDLDTVSGALTLRAAGPAGFALHEGKCDRSGRFWIGSVPDELRIHRRPAPSSLYRLDGDTLTPLFDDMIVTNSMAFSPAGDRMIFSNSWTGAIYVCDYDDATGTPSNRRLFTEIPLGDGTPDGALIDAEGGYWLSLFLGGLLRRYLPDGTIDREIELPFACPTMLAFAGAGLDYCYLTTGSYIAVDAHTDSVRGRPPGGGLYRLDIGAPGLAEPLFQG